MKRILGILLSLAMAIGMITVCGSVDARADWVPAGSYVISIEEGNILSFSDETYDETYDLTFGKWYKFNSGATFNFVNHISGTHYFYIYVKYKSETRECYSHRGAGINQSAVNDPTPLARHFWQAEEEEEEGTALLYAPHYMRVTYSIPEYDRINVTFEISLTDPRPQDSGATVAPTHEHNWSFGTINSPTEDCDGLEGEICSICGATRNTSVIPSTCAVIDNRYLQIEQANPGSSPIIEMKLLSTFSKAFMEKLASRNDLDYRIRFTYNHKNYEIHIPIGTKIDTSLDWYGPEKMMQLYEWKEMN